MKVVQDQAAIAVSTFYYTIEITAERFRLKDPRTGTLLIDCPTPILYRPEFRSEDDRWRFRGWAVDVADSGPVRIGIAADGEDDTSLETTLTCFEEHIEVSAQTGPLRSDTTVRHWNILAPGTKLDLFHVHHWRNRYGHTATYETYNLMQGSRYGEDIGGNLPDEMRRQWTTLTNLTTRSTDWQFAPRPSVFLIQRDTVMLGIGARDLPNGFGLEMCCARMTLRHLRFNYGADHGYPLAAGERAVAPRFYLWLDHHGGVWDSVDRYTDLLRQDGATEMRDNRQTPHWWSRPQFCTWQDQCLISDNPSFYNWMGDRPAGLGPVHSFDEPMLDYLLDRIENERLNVGSVIIDDGWQKERGEWIAHPERFPRLRRQIDRIHAMGMKALLWFAPLDFYEGSAVLDRPEFLCGAGRKGPSGTCLVDYSHPLVQQGYVRPMMRYFFSDEPDCLNADGFKTDFMADKVHAEFPVHDRVWRGEEPFISHMLRLFYDEMRSFKPDGMHLGCVAHPAFTHVQDVIRTYDVPASQMQHEDRARMLRHFAPGNFVSLDLSECRSLADIEQHLDIAFRNNLLYQLPRIGVDLRSDESALGPDYFPLLRRRLPAWG